MREIKFRAWIPKSKEFVYWNILPLVSSHRTENSNAIFVKDIQIEYVNQFTGLKDKNGKEIYEGDICVMDILGKGRKHNPIEALMVEVKIQNLTSGFVHTHPNLVNEDDREWCPFYIHDDREFWSPNYFEVIGNIFENPDLLNKPA